MACDKAEPKGGVCEVDGTSQGYSSVDPNKVPFGKLLQAKVPKGKTKAMSQVPPLQMQPLGSLLFSQWATGKG